MSGLSIIIPAHSDMQALEDTLAAVLGNRPRACEVIVPHAGTYDDPYDLASEVWFISLPPKTDVNTCIADAMAKASGGVIHLLWPGCEVEENWWRAAWDRFEDPEVASVAPAILAGRSERDEILAAGVACGVLGRVELGRGLTVDEGRMGRLRAVGPTRLAGFYRRSAVKQAGGWPSAVGEELADVDLALSMQQLGYKAAVEPASKVICQIPWRPRDSAFARARNRERLWRRHVSAPGLLPRVMIHPLVATWECLTAGGPAAMAAAAAGKLASLWDAGDCRRHRELLRAAKQQAPPKRPREKPQRLRKAA